MKYDLSLQRISLIKKWINRIVYYLIIGVICWFWLAPMLWILVMALKPNSALLRSTAGLIPIPFTFKNLNDIATGSRTPQWFLNSVIVSTSTALLTLLISSLAAYAIARIKFIGKSFVFLFILAGLMVPFQAIFIPLYVMLAKWQLHNTYFALILPNLAAPLGVFLLTQFFRSIPQEIEEAAYLDGANRFTIYAQIIIPLSLPALTSLGIFTFLWTWNDYLWPLVTATKINMYTITVGLATMQGQFAQTQGLGFLMAAAVFASAPIVLLFLTFEKYIVEGITLGKGRF